MFCLFLIYYTFEWLHFVSESAHGKICINKLTVHRGAYGHPIASVLSWCKQLCTCMCMLFDTFNLSLYCFTHWEPSNEIGWQTTHSILCAKWSEMRTQYKEWLKSLKKRENCKWKYGMLVRNISNVRDCSSSEENRSGNGETVKSARKWRRRPLFELCPEKIYLF